MGIGTGGNVTLSLALTPTSGMQTSASFAALVTFAYSGTAPTGTLTLSIDGNASGANTLALNSSNQQSIGVGLSSSASVGAHTVVAHYSGDSNWAAADSPSATFTVTSADPSTVSSQAFARVQYVTAASSGTLTRTQIENGELTAQVYTVTGIAILASGRGRYDSNTVATITGTVAGAAVRETLTVVLDDSGGISSLTGFDNTAQWDAPPVLTISRWDGTGDSANYLGN